LFFIGLRDKEETDMAITKTAAEGILNTLKNGDSLWTLQKNGVVEECIFLDYTSNVMKYGVKILPHDCDYEIRYFHIDSLTSADAFYLDLALNLDSLTYLP